MDVLIVGGFVGLAVFSYFYLREDEPEQAKQYHQNRTGRQSSNVVVSQPRFSQHELTIAKDCLRSIGYTAKEAKNVISQYENRSSNLNQLIENCLRHESTNKTA